MAMPVRTMSKWAAGSRMVAALLAQWAMRREGPRLELGRQGREALELKAEEGGIVFVGGGEVAHEARQGGPGPLGQGRRLVLTYAQTAHAGVELDVHAQVVPQRLAEVGLRPDPDIGVRPAARAVLGPGQRAEDEDGRRQGGLAQLLGLGHGGHAQPRSARLQRGAGHRHGPVTVAVGLDHGAERAAGRQQRREIGDVVAHGREVDRRQGALSVVEHLEPQHADDVVARDDADERVVLDYRHAVDLLVDHDVRGPRDRVVGRRR